MLIRTTGFHIFFNIHGIYRAARQICNHLHTYDKGKSHGDQERKEDPSTSAEVKHDPSSVAMLELE